MKLSILDNVLFDEFPSDETTKICIFTQPKYPKEDYAKYNGQVKFYCTKDIFHVMGAFTNIPSGVFRLLSERQTKLEGMKNVGIRCIPTGNISLSVMLLIHIGDDIHLYTGQCNRFRDVVLRPIVLHYKDRLNDIHVDNTLANFRQTGLLSETCKRIYDLITKYNEHTIYVHMELFGCEDILFELAHAGIKIQLARPQKVLFDRCNHGQLFEFDGEPQLKIFADIRELPYFRIKDYAAQFRNKIIHIELVAMEHPKVHTFSESSESEIETGLFYVPYTPHPTAYDLHFLFQTLEPKRVHLLVPQGFQDDQMSKIPEDILNDGCKIIDIDRNDQDVIDDTNSRSFLDSSNEFADSLAVSVEISDFDDVQPDNSRYHEATNGQSNQLVECVEESTAPDDVEIVNIQNDPIEISDDDDMYDLGLESSHSDTALKNAPEEDVQMKEKEADKNVSNQTDAAQQNDEVVEHTTAPRPDNLSMRSQNSINHGQIKSKQVARPNSKKRRYPRYTLPKPVEYLPDSDDERNENESSAAKRSGQEGSLQFNDKEADKSAPIQSDKHADQQNDANNNEDTTTNDNLFNRCQSSVINNTKSPQIVNQTEHPSEDGRGVNEIMDTDNSEVESDDFVIFPS